MIKNKNEKDLIKKLIELTNKILPMPDIILYLEATNHLIKSHLLKRGRVFEKKFLKNALKINQSHIHYFSNKNLKQKYLNTQILKIKADKFKPDFIAKRIGLFKINDY
jgi:deoxyadenosine/deoxycytidine kinase